MRITELKAYLKKTSPKEIENILVELYKSNQFCKEYINNKIQPENENIILQQYKDIITKEFFPERGDPKLRYSLIRKSVSEFKKICRTPNNYVDLLLHYIECGIEFTNAYGDIDQNYYIRFANLYTDTLNYIFDNDLENNFDDRCLKLKMSTENIGWGFYQEMNDIYYAFYDIDFES
jgi:hypothetical protein